MKFFSEHRQKFFSALLIAAFCIFFVSSSFAQDDDEEFIQGDDEFVQGEDSQNDAVKLFNQGQEAHSKGDLQKALKLYGEALKIHSKFPEAEYQRGTIYQYLGKHIFAEKSFRRALELKKDWILPMTNLGVVLVQQNKFLEAETLLTKSIGLNSSNFPAYVALTDLRIKTKSSNEKLQSLLGRIKPLTDKTRTPASIWVSRGLLEKILRDNNSAKSSFKNALQINPKNFIALTKIVEINLLEKDSKLAIINSKKLLQIYPNSDDAKMLLARSYNLKGDSKEALKTLESIEKRSKEVVALENIIKNEGNENVEDLEKMLETDANNASVLGRLCFLTRATNPQKSLNYCQKALEIDKKNLKYAIGVGAALLQLRNYDNAIAVFQGLLKYDPENFTIRANLATALFQVKRFEEAKIEYLWITQKKPDLAVAYYFLAIAYDRLTEFVDAKENYQKFLELADQEKQKIEIERVNLRIPILQKQIRNGKGKKRKGGK